MKPVKWEFTTFFERFLAVQGSAIMSLIVAEESSPWKWSACLFGGIVGTVLWDTTKFKKAQKEQE